MDNAANSKRRIHIALAVDDLATTIADYSKRLRAHPVAVVPGKYALWRTAEVNLSINCNVDTTHRLRHLGFEEEDVTAKTETLDVNGVVWESFSPTLQNEGIVEVYGPPVGAKPSARTSGASSCERTNRETD